MNVILLVGLLVLAYVLFSMGLEFFGLLTAVLGVLLVAAGLGSKAKEERGVKITEPFGPQGPIVVENKLPDIPPRLNFKIHPNWHEYQVFEYQMFNWGAAWHNLGHWLFNLLTGSRPPKKSGGGH